MLNDILISTLFAAKAGGLTPVYCAKGRKEVNIPLYSVFAFQNNEEIRFCSHFAPKEKTFYVGFKWAENTTFPDFNQSMLLAALFIQHSLALYETHHQRYPSEKPEDNISLVYRCAMRHFICKSY